MEIALNYQIAFSLLPRIGPVAARNLLAYFGSAEKVFTVKATHLREVPGIGKLFADSILNNRQNALELAEEELKYIEANDVGTMSFFEKDFPKRLKNCQDAPLMVYYLGKRPVWDDISLGVVGTRMATRKGKELTRTLVSDLKTKGLNPLIVSGLAYGIDINSHLAAIENELTTWAVLGHGFDIIYPASHREHAEQIKASGGTLISEYPTVAIRDKKNFVKRNRIIAGLSDALVVVESAKKGGAMVTADVANSYNRDVFAFPGKPGDKVSEGCNHLIKTNRAALIESADDILYHMGWSSNKEADHKQRDIAFDISLDENEKILFDIIREKEYCDLDQLKNISRLNIADLSLSLLSLEMKSVIDALPGKIYTVRTAR
ncbi:MAG: DNA-processing protein DprA [Bacteroidales bacterium]|jgi:DNA processing protein|nr:DNA-processing protein DprA [Bacteroidales bacterium]